MGDGVGVHPRSSSKLKRADFQVRIAARIANMCFRMNGLCLGF